MPIRRYSIEEMMTGVALAPVVQHAVPTPARTLEDLDMAKAGDSVVAHLDPGDYLESQGWSFSHGDGDGHRYYSRPGKSPSEGISATVFADGQVFSHSNSTAITKIPHGPTEKAAGRPGSFDVFGLVAHIEHGGDFTAARRALNADGYGKAAEELPPWEDWVADVHRRAAERGVDLEPTHPDGGDPPADDGEDTPGPDSVAELVRSRLLQGRNILNVQPKAPLIEDWLDVGDLAVLYGPPGAGKSFVSIDMAASIASGQPWQGQETRQGTVVYIVAEGSQGIPSRWRAWMAHHEVESGDLPNLWWLPMRINLRSREWSRGVAEAVLDLQPSLVIVDTLARTFDGGDENSSSDMGAYVAGLDDLRELTGATVLVVHHSGKNVAAGGRGHSSLLGAVDAELALKPTGKRAFTLESTKQKDREQEEPVAFRLIPSADSVVVQLDDSLSAIGPITETVDRLMGVLDALRSIAGSDGATTNAWRDACMERDLVASETIFKRAKKDLEDRGGVTNQGTRARASWQPVRSVLTDPSMLLNEDELELWNKAEMAPVINPTDVTQTD